MVVQRVVPMANLQVDNLDVSLADMLAGKMGASLAVQKGLVRAVVMVNEKVEKKVFQMADVRGTMMDQLMVEHLAVRKAYGLDYVKADCWVSLKVWHKVVVSVL